MIFCDYYFWAISRDFVPHFLKQRDINSYFNVDLNEPTTVIHGFIFAEMQKIISLESTVSMTNFDMLIFAGFQLVNNCSDQQTAAAPVSLWPVPPLRPEVLQLNQPRTEVIINHRRRIALEDRAKVVASVWGTESLPRQLFCLGLFETYGWVQASPLPR